jgi:uncharacterized protein (TIGR02246 family)
MLARSVMLACHVAFLAFLGGVLTGRTADGQEESADEAIRASTRQVAELFNGGKAAEIAQLFLPESELVDDEGNIYHGRQEIESLLARFFESFPGAEASFEIESIRMVTPVVALEEGRRSVVTANDGTAAHHHYLAVRVLVDGNWRFASFREVADEAPPTPGDHLQPLAWLVGHWISEGHESAARITYRWSEDGNFLLGEFEIRRNGEVLMKTSQRIGWDPLAQQVRSWLFDSDGGYGGGRWSLVEDSWVIKSTAVTPEGLSGSATVTITPVGPHQFRMRGTDRIAGNERLADFDLEVTRQPPQAAN